MDSIATLARRIADDRRSLLTLFTGQHRHVVALDLMGVPVPLARPAQREFAAVVADTQADALRRAEVIVADADMSLLVDAATPTMPDQVLREDDPLCRHGLVGFAAPLTDRSGLPPLLPIEALSWTLLPDGHPATGGRAPGAAGSVLLTAYVRSDTAGVAPGQGVPRLVPNSTVAWTLGTETGAAYGVRSSAPGAAPAFYQRLAAAFWTLAKQPLAESVPSVMAPKDRRRYSRAGLDNVSAVRVVQLRGHASRQEAGAPGSREYRHRHLVRGYWRNTWFGTLQAHRQQWIDGYVRGPQGAPLLTGDKVLVARGPAPAATAGPGVEGLRQ